MDLPAYRGDAARKQQLVQRLRDLARANHWVVRPLHWNGEAGSLVGSLLRSEDLDEWKSGHGLPNWLALALDGLFVAAPDPLLGAHAGIELLDAIAPGADLGTAGNRCLVGLLQGPDHGLTTLAVPSALTDVLNQVTGLHRARMRGLSVETGQWRSARRVAVDATNALTPETPEATMGACIEAAAWDPACSRTAVSDTLRIWGWAMGAAAQAPEPRNMPGMSDEEDASIRVLLKCLYDEAKAESQDPNAHIDVLKLASEKRPEVYARMRANMDFHSAQLREFRTALWQRGVNVLRDALTTRTMDRDGGAT